MRAALLLVLVPVLVPTGAISLATLVAVDAADLVIGSADTLMQDDAASVLVPVPVPGPVSEEKGAGGAVTSDFRLLSRSNDAR